MHIDIKMVPCREHFVNGESGSIIFAERTTDDETTERFAVAILKGVRPGTQHRRHPIYEAVILHPALQEILGHTHFNVVPVRPTQADDS